MHHSFTHRAPRLFNALPKVLHNVPDDTPMDSVKNKIDKYVRKITDEPRLPGYYPCNSSASNRVEDQIQATEFLSEDHL